ncbi:MAG: YbaK/EbsC family protein [Phycisphaerae bacterium]|nr:YbaK/EbsC family protein [Phycisphaerae bacterium]
MDIEKYLTEASVKYKLLKHPEAYTAQEVAAEEHVSGDMVAKSVLVNAGDKSVLCVLPASCKIDLGKLACALEVKACRLAEEAELGKVFPDVEIGAEPPFGKPYGLETLVDTRLSQCRTVTFTAGTHRQAVQMAYEDYAALAEATVIDFALHL